MAGITLEQAQEQLSAALDNLLRARKVRESQVAGSVGGRKTTNHDLSQLQADVDYWNNQVKLLSRRGGLGGIVTYHGVPCG